MKEIVPAWIQEAIDQTLRFGRGHIAAGEKIIEAAEKRLLKMPGEKADARRAV
jgi:hypothetical protein